MKRNSNPSSNHYSKSNSYQHTKLPTNTHQLTYILHTHTYTQTHPHSAFHTSLNSPPTTTTITTTHTQKNKHLKNKKPFDVINADFAQFSDF